MRSTEVRKGNRGWVLLICVLSNVLIFSSVSFAASKDEKKGNKKSNMQTQKQEKKLVTAGGIPAPAMKPPPPAMARTYTAKAPAKPAMATTGKFGKDPQKFAQAIKRIGTIQDKGVLTKLSDPKARVALKSVSSAVGKKRTAATP